VPLLHFVLWRPVSLGVIPLVVRLPGIYSADDALCRGVHRAKLLGCPVGDDLGFVATLLILGLGPIALAGLFGRALSRRLERSSAPWATVVVSLVIFSGLLGAVMSGDDRQAARQSLVSSAAEPVRSFDHPVD
jgi:hypothetical protein